MNNLPADSFGQVILFTKEGLLSLAYLFENQLDIKIDLNTFINIPTQEEFRIDKMYYSKNAVCTKIDKKTDSYIKECVFSNKRMQVVGKIDKSIHVETFDNSENKDSYNDYLSFLNNMWYNKNLTSSNDNWVLCFPRINLLNSDFLTKDDLLDGTCYKCYITSIFKPNKIGRSKDTIRWNIDLTNIDDNKYIVGNNKNIIDYFHEL